LETVRKGRVCVPYQKNGWEKGTIGGSMLSDFRDIPVTVSPGVGGAGITRR
jgi:hypothetical protein